MFTPDMTHDWDFGDNNPWKWEVDRRMCPSGTQVQGWAALHKRDGWTLISFYDRSVDSRPGSNSSFLAEGNFTFEEMLGIAREYFPRVMSRFTFEIVEAPR